MGGTSICTPVGKRMQNIVLHTYALHAQAHSCFFKAPVDLDLLGQVRACAKLVLDELPVFVGLSGPTSSAERGARMGCGSGGKGDAWLRLEYAFETMQRMRFPDKAEKDWTDKMKLLCTKLLQVSLL